MPHSLFEAQANPAIAPIEPDGAGPPQPVWHGEWTVILHHAESGQQKKIIARGSTLDDAIADALRAKHLKGRWLPVPSATRKLWR